MDEIDKLLAGARQGTREAIYSLIGDFILAVQEGKEPKPRLQQFIAELLFRVLRGDDPRKVFPTPKSHSEKSRDKYWRDWDWAVAVAKKIEAGASEADAIADVANEFKRETGQKKESSIKAAYQEHRQSAQEWVGLRPPSDPIG